ncbi:MAG: hypothetical protein A4E37_00215 [Methanoregulaceae archaeon PtaB.Bin056]|jgi:hypothetical protein|nr:MAG: hypothetical protein A4E37_00215 [Methanoregulaceae archaeon PtaB.Bin056]
MWKGRPIVQLVFIKNDSGQLSIDFIVGLSIFMIALIMAATMAAGLLSGLQSKHIDYDAVAYRTAVMLVEDPGEPVETVGKSIFSNPYPKYQWEFVINGLEKPFVKRFGLAVSKSTSGVISSKKLGRFMDNTFYSADDYKNKLLFSDYPYNFNITIQRDGEIPQTIGDIYHENSQYGYIRRMIFEKESGTIKVILANYNLPGGDGKLTVEIWTSDFLNSLPGDGSTYILDPYRENVKINLSFDGVIPKLDPVSGDPIPVRLESVHCEYFSKDEINPIQGTGIPVNTANFIYRLSSGTEITPPYEIGTPDYLITDLGRLLDNPDLGSIDKPIILITYDFGATADISGREISTAHDDYAGPELIPAWMEVRVW